MDRPSADLEVLRVLVSSRLRTARPKGAHGARADELFAAMQYLVVQYPTRQVWVREMDPLLPLLRYVAQSQRGASSELVAEALKGLVDAAEPKRRKAWRTALLTDQKSLPRLAALAAAIRPANAPPSGNYSNGPKYAATYGLAELILRASAAREAESTLDGKAAVSTDAISATPQTPSTSGVRPPDLSPDLRRVVGLIARSAYCSAYVGFLGMCIYSTLQPVRDFYGTVRSGRMAGPMTATDLAIIELYHLVRVQRLWSQIDLLGSPLEDTDFVPYYQLVEEQHVAVRDDVALFQEIEEGASSFQHFIRKLRIADEIDFASPWFAMKRDPEVASTTLLHLGGAYTMLGLMLTAGFVAQIDEDEIGAGATTLLPSSLLMAIHGTEQSIRTTELVGCMGVEESIWAEGRLVPGPSYLLGSRPRP